MDQFELEVDGEPIPATAWHRRRASDLVKLLVLAPRHRLNRDQVADALSPEMDPERDGGQRGCGGARAVTEADLEGKNASFTYPKEWAAHIARADNVVNF